jgi:hypothetical protein
VSTLEATDINSVQATIPHDLSDGLLWIFVIASNEKFSSNVGW